MKKLIAIFTLILTCQSYAQQSKSVLGHVDFYTLLKSTPELQSTPETAFAYACNSDINCQGDSQLELKYDDFKKKSDLYASQLASSLEAKSQNYFGNKGNTGMYKDSKKQVNQNELIKQMGGIDKISQMSEKERELAARKALASNSSSTLSPFTEEQKQRMMNDPEYAKQMVANYNKMTDKQKAGLVRSRMENENVQVSNEEFEKRLKQSQSVKNTMDVNRFVGKITSKLSTASELYTANVEKVRSTAGKHEDLDKSYGEEYKKIPLVIMGEGKEPDPKKVRALDISYALKHKKRAALELSQAQIEYKKFKAIINEAISEYHSYLDANGYRVNGKMKDIYNGTNTELSLAQLEVTIGESISKLAEISYSENSTASGYEQSYQYQLTMK